MTIGSPAPRAVLARLARLRRQAGFTLIELMIAMIVASILIAMSFSIYTRMSVAYRAQQDVSELQQTLRAAKMKLSKDIRAAGYLIPNGFERNNGGVAEHVDSLIVTNNTDLGDNTFSTDEIRVYYADADAIAVIQSRLSGTEVTVDDGGDFDVGDLVVFTRPNYIASPTTGAANIITYDACLVRITAIAGTTPATVTFGTTGAPFNSAANTHCSDASILNFSDMILRAPVMYRFVGRAYRIEPTLANRRTGILQMSPSGGLIANDWQIMGVGFTNLQLAVRYFEDADAVDADGDTDPTRDWYSGSVLPVAGAIPIELSLSLEVRPIRELDVVPTAATPSFIESGGVVNHNRIGDWDSVTLFGVADGARPTQYRGNHIYRWSTSSVDIRNMGVGR